MIKLSQDNNKLVDKNICIRINNFINSKPILLCNQDIIDYIKLYNGFTIYSEVNKHITSGFIVAIKNIYKKKIKLQNISLDETDALLIIINEIVRNYNCEIGLWYDEVNSIIYIDEIIILNDINKAIKIASKNNQEVICDLQNQIEIII